MPIGAGAAHQVRFFAGLQVPGNKDVGVASGPEVDEHLPLSATPACRIPNFPLDERADRAALHVDLEDPGVSFAVQSRNNQRGTVRPPAQLHTGSHQRGCRASPDSIARIVMVVPGGGVIPPRQEREELSVGRPARQAP
jgi:hypothetical protein